MSKLTFRNPKTKQTQEVGENETVKQGILKRLGWKQAGEPVGDEAPAIEMPEKLPSDGQSPAKNVSQNEAESHQPAQPKRKRRNKDGTPLPANMPGLSILTWAGYETVESVKALSDEKLMSLSGMGTDTLKAIRKALR